MPGQLINIEQHSDAVVTEFAFTYVLSDGTYNRYFVIKRLGDKKNENLIYMGSDATKINPEKNLYFKPTDPLALGDN